MWFVYGIHVCVCVCVCMCVCVCVCVCMVLFVCFFVPACVSECFSYTSSTFFSALLVNILYHWFLANPFLQISTPLFYLLVLYQSTSFSSFFKSKFRKVLIFSVFFLVFVSICLFILSWQRLRSKLLASSLVLYCSFGDFLFSLLFYFIQIIDKYWQFTNFIR